MSEGATQSLVCAVCKQSCEGKPHAKDAKGRVICRACMDKKKAARAATDTGGAGVMADLLGKSKMANAVPCPNCKSYMPQGTVVCTHCGYNTETQKVAATRVVEAPKERAKKEKAEGAGLSLSFDPMMGVWAMVLVYAALAVGCFAMPSLVLVMYLVLGVHGTVVSVWYIVAAFIDGDPMWGIIMLIPIVNILGLYYILVKSQRFVLKYHFVMVIGFTILMVLLATSVLDPEMLESAWAPTPDAPAQLG